jgi:hypothetical protein
MPYIGNPVYQSAFVTDTFSGNGSTVAFTMSVAPASSASVLVAVSGVLQTPSTYGVAGNTLTFSGAPPSGTGNISVRYLGIPVTGISTTAYRTVTEFTATAGQTTFTPPSYTVGFISVYRNGVLLGSADYTATNGTTVVLATGATAGDLVTTESFLVSSVLNAISNTAASVSSSNLTNGSITQAKLSTNVAGNGPAFSATIASNQSMTTNTWTKCQCATEEFDTNSNYDNATNYRFTPTVSGYYQVNGGVAFSSSSGNSQNAVAIYKNGSSFKVGTNIYPSGAPAASVGVVSALIYFNGSTDYVELYGLQVATSLPVMTTNTYFQASLVRAA